MAELTVELSFVALSRRVCARELSLETRFGKGRPGSRNGVVKAAGATGASGETRGRRSARDHQLGNLLGCSDNPDSDWLMPNYPFYAHPPNVALCIQEQ